MARFRQRGVPFRLRALCPPPDGGFSHYPRVAFPPPLPQWATFVPSPPGTPSNKPLCSVDILLEPVHEIFLRLAGRYSFSDIILVAISRQSHVFKNSRTWFFYAGLIEPLGCAMGVRGDDNSLLPDTLRTGMPLEVCELARRGLSLDPAGD